MQPDTTGIEGAVDQTTTPMVDRRGLRSLNEVDRRGYPGERVKCEQADEENVPEVSAGVLSS